MALATQWPAVLNALQWAKGSGRVLGRTEYGVNGALALVAEHARASDPEAAAKAAERGAKAKAGAGLRLAAKDALAAAQGEADTLRKQLAEAVERIASLEARLKGPSLHSGVKTVEAPPDYAWAQSVNGISLATKAKAKKVHGLYKRSATEAECHAAKERLEEMAAKAGMTFEAFLTAYGFPL